MDFLILLLMNKNLASSITWVDLYFILNKLLTYSSCIFFIKMYLFKYKWINKITIHFN